MDLKKEIKSFVPIDIEQFSQSNDASEKMIDSVKLYNKAIGYLQTGSEDIAMIELKKIVSINPDFYEAVNLLGLCFAYTNQMDKAEALFEKAAQDERNAQKAKEYLNYIYNGDYNPAKKTNKVKVSTPEKKPNKVEKETRNRDSYNEDSIQTEYFLVKKISILLKKPSIVIIVNIISIICLIAALILFLSDSQTKKIDVASETTNITKLTDSNNKVLAENKTLKNQLETANNKLKEIQLSSDLSQISSLYGQGKYVEAADKLITLPVNELSKDLKTKYDSIKSNVFLKAANQLTKEGHTLFGRKKYAEAIEKLEKVFQYGDKWTFGDKALYDLAKSYVEVNEIQKAITAYQKLINEYPNSGYLKYAKSRLAAIQ